jgi:hypothetical protein
MGPVGLEFKISRVDRGFERVDGGLLFLFFFFLFSFFFSPLNVRFLGEGEKAVEG